MNKENLADYRKRIDEIDAEIGKFIRERLEIVGKVGKLKVNSDISVTDEERIKKVYKNFAEKSGLCLNDAKKIYSPLIEYCIEMEEK
ncbi:MAG: chorismate mutase, partial [Candidatus Altiarchaeum hamiconexum]|nr:chorismate mutase [Candidatus Altarchaeum hamiconexum]